MILILYKLFLWIVGNNVYITMSSFTFNNYINFISVSNKSAFYLNEEQKKHILRFVARI